MTATTDQLLVIFPTSQPVDGFLATAVTFVTPLLQGKGLTVDLFDQVVLYVAAHFCVLSLEQGGLKRSRLGDGDEFYKTPGDFDIGFRSTRFGQMAMILDTTGILASSATNSGLKAKFEVIGGERSSWGPQKTNSLGIPS